MLRAVATARPSTAAAEASSVAAAICASSRAMGPPSRKGAPGRDRRGRGHHARVRRRGEDAPAERGVVRAEEEVHGRARPVAARATAHLVELHSAERHAVEHHVANAGEVHALPEGARRDDAREVVATERPLDAGTHVARQAGVIEGRSRGELGYAVAQRPHQRDREVARGDVHDALLAPGNDAHERGLAVSQRAPVVDDEVLPAREVADDVCAVDPGEGADPLRHLGRGGCRDGERRGVPARRGPPAAQE